MLESKVMKGYLYDNYLLLLTSVAKCHAHKSTAHTTLHANNNKFRNSCNVNSLLDPALSALYVKLFKALRLI